MTETKTMMTRNGISIQIIPNGSCAGRAAVGPVPAGTVPAAVVVAVVEGATGSPASGGAS